MMKSSLLEALKNGNNKVLRNIYLDYKEAFFHFAKKHQLTSEEILDIYQDVILALKENAVLGKITPSNSSLKTYLFGIGKYMIYDVLRKKKKVFLTNDFDEEVTESNFDILFQKELTTPQKKLQQAFSSLGDKCKEVLTLFYYRGFTIEEITTHLKYRNKDVVKSQKHRCLKSLKDKMI